MIGFERVGAGEAGVVVMNDWMCDTSTWDGARPYLDGDRFSWVFADLRGYGRSIDQPGDFTIEEASGDILSVADSLGWQRFSVVGHSMSTLIALHLAQHHPDRIERAVLLTPPPPTGFGDEAALKQLRMLAHADEQTKTASLRARSGARLSEKWTGFKARRWSERSRPEAVAGYAAMFATRGLPEPSLPIKVPLLAVTGEQDAESMRREAVSGFLSPISQDLTLVSIHDSGHYPMQETPPLLVSIVERFLKNPFH